MKSRRIIMNQTLSDLDSGAPPLIRQIHYNGSAYRHIRENRLDLPAELERLRSEGPPHPAIASNRTIPALPGDAMIVMSAWWPIGGDEPTPMPVWDGEREHRDAGSNSYVNWPRIIAVVPNGPLAAHSSFGPVAFAGRIVRRPGVVSLARFYHVPVTASMVAEMASDSEASRLAGLVLGRPLQVGDYLALVGLHLMTARLSNGTWGTFWWHDLPAQKPFGADRPEGLPASFANYLMDATFDAQLPTEADGSPNVCFNPWLDGGLENGVPENEGRANGVTSNCVSCHSRASYPAMDFVPVTRGLPDIGRDRTYQSGQLRTGMVWTIPLNSLFAVNATATLKAGRLESTGLLLRDERTAAFDTPSEVENGS